MFSLSCLCAGTPSRERKAASSSAERRECGHAAMPNHLRAHDYTSTHAVKVTVGVATLAVLSIFSWLASNWILQRAQTSCQALPARGSWGDVAAWKAWVDPGHWLFDPPAPPETGRLSVAGLAIVMFLLGAFGFVARAVHFAWNQYEERERQQQLQQQREQFARDRQLAENMQLAEVMQRHAEVETGSATRRLRWLVEGAHGVAAGAESEFAADGALRDQAEQLARDRQLAGNMQLAGVMQRHAGVETGSATRRLRRQVKGAHGVGALRDQAECCVCMHGRKTQIFMPCRHICVCAGCASKIMANRRACPICRGVTTDWSTCDTYVPTCRVWERCGDGALLWLPGAGGAARALPWVRFSRGKALGTLECHADLRMSRDDMGVTFPQAT